MYNANNENGKYKFKPVEREKGIQALMTTNLLKRLESSVHSFRLTLEKLKVKHTELLSKIHYFEKSGKSMDLTKFTSDFEDMEMGDEEVAGIEETTLSKNVPINLADMDLPSWKHDLKSDMFIIDALLQEMYKITPEDDFKLQHIQTHIDEKLANPINEGNKKVLIFTAYADTANYL